MAYQVEIILPSPKFQPYIEYYKNVVADSEYSKMDVPTLICLGELSLPFYHRTMNEINQALPNSTLVEIPGSGHMIQLENPKEFNRVLRQFL